MDCTYWLICNISLAIFLSVCVCVYLGSKFSCFKGSSRCVCWLTAALRRRGTRFLVAQAQRRLFLSRSDTGIDLLRDVIGVSNWLKTLPQVVHLR